jgi:hypothetical protein
MTALRNAALLTDEELALGKRQWRKFHDPFPDWEAEYGL